MTTPKAKKTDGKKRQTHTEHHPSSEGFHRGDVVYRPTMSEKSFYHEGVYVGDNQVVHVYANPTYTGVSVQKVPLEKFARGKTVKVKKSFGNHHNRQLKRLPGDQAAKRAESAVGMSWKYDRVWNNCENFTNWAATGNSVSQQGQLSITLGILAACTWRGDKPMDVATLLTGFFGGLAVAGCLNRLVYEQQQHEGDNPSENRSTRQNEIVS